MRKHDQEYKKLFSNREMLKTLLESFVPEPWVQNLDYDKAERVEKSFITKGLKERESDLIWKLGWKGDEVYIYLLLEFQSSVDYFMALRVLRYICELYQSLIDEGKFKKGQKLPAVFPVVLYNGDEPWSAPEAIAELIVGGVNSLHIPQFRYFKLAENEYDKEFLYKLENAVAVVFYAENADPGSLHDSFEWLMKILESEKNETVTVLLSNFLVRLYQRNQKPEAIHELSDRTEALKEVPQMFEANFERWKARIAAEAEQRAMTVGREEGREQGHSEGISEVARRMLTAGYEAKTISELTGLSEESVKKL